MMNVNHLNRDDEDLGGMPPLPRPQRPPAMRPHGVVAPTSRAARADDHESATADELLLRPEAPAPRPHAHPLQGLAPAPMATAAPSSRPTATGTIPHNAPSAPSAVRCENAHRAECLAKNRPPLRSRNVEMQRLEPTFLNPNRVSALAVLLDKENSPVIVDASIEKHSTRLLERQIALVENQEVSTPKIDDTDRRMAATEASAYRQTLRLLPEAAPPANDSAVERARQRKVKKQVDPKWLANRQDPNRPRPVAPLERLHERHLYETTYEWTLADVLASGILADDDDYRQRQEDMGPELWTLLPQVTRGTTGLFGCCFDEWSFE